MPDFVFFRVHGAGRRDVLRRWLGTAVLCFVSLLFSEHLLAAVTEINSAGGTTSTNGLHFYLEDTTKIQVRRLNNTGQVYHPSRTPPHTNLDNGIFLRANGATYGPSNWAFSVPMYSTYSISAVSPANPATVGVPQTATHAFGVALGPQVSIVWKYVLPYDFITAEVILTIPASYAVSAANPVRYYHVIDTFLGGSDNGCGVTFSDTKGKRVVGTYPPPSGTSCPSSSAVPAGVSVVESFRERSGLNFSHYCVNTWSNFWDSATSGTACAIRRSASLNDAVSTTYSDTGVGIEYDFTAAGTYTFSYDFVIGSTQVPAYDHLEIQHDGSATLCPENVTVLACTSSSVPCPELDRVATGSLTGSVTTTPATPSVTKTPATFTLGTDASTATVALQGTSPGGGYTLGSSGLSSVPLNGTRCWNTATGTQGCTLTVSNTPCVADFECLETGAAYSNQSVSSPAGRNPLYTKLVASDFKFDVVALQSSGAVATGYTASSNVTVELFDDTASPRPSCSAYTSPVASTSITFASGDNGRKTLPAVFNLNKAYQKLRCRVKDTNLSPAVYGCSSDDFSVRPQSFTSLSSPDANAHAGGTSASATPVVRAGAAFTLKADTGVPGYDGKPLANASLLEWTAPPSGGRSSPGTGGLDGSTPGNLIFSTAASSVTGNGASGSFTYDDAGYFRFKANGVYDNTFTDASSDKANGDCVVDSFFNTLNASGKYGCNFGNTAASSYFGRFIPDHFDTVVAQACSDGSFTYSGQPFALTIYAKNLGGSVTQNYAGAFAKAVTLTARNSADTADNPGPGAFASNTVLATAFSAGVGSVSPAYSVANKRTAPTSVVVRASDADGVKSLRSPTALTVEGSAAIRSGRARLSNAYGSELLDLPVVFRTEFWDGAGWVLNTADKCTGNESLGSANAVSVALALSPSGLPTCVRDNGSGTGLSGAGCSAASASARTFREGAATSVGFAGDFNLWLKAPGANQFGSATLTATVPPWLGGSLKARAVFGRYKSPLIYRRENY